MSLEDPQLDQRAGLPRIGKRRPHERGTSNSNERGSSYNRRARKAWLMENWKSDVEGFVRCYRCGMKLDENALTVDRIRPGCQGGTYKRDNIRPCCSLCNTLTGATTRSTP